MSSRFLLVAVSLVGALAIAAGSCSSDAESREGVEVPDCNTPGCLGSAPDAALDLVIGDVVAPDVDEADDTVELLALCGEGCRTDADGTVLYPGDPGACEGVEGPPSAGGAGGAAPIALGCAVTRGAGDLPQTECVPAGTADSGACVTSADCAPGYACVGQNNAAQCLPYCCTDPESCGEGTFCSAQPLHQPEQMAGNPLLVPVCIAAHDCWLDEPYPCPEDETCTCPEEQACTVVRADGTTGCVTPGEGMEGEPCPCAPASENSLGYVCSQATQTCVKVCALGTSTSGCGAGSRCQATAALQDRFGVCTTSYNLDAG